VFIALGVIVSWVWSVELTIAGESVNAAIAGAATLFLFCAGIIVIARMSPHRGRRATLAFRIGVIGTALGAVVAGIVPIAVTSSTTGTATAAVTSGAIGGAYRVARVAVVSSDTYHRTSLDLTVSARDRTTPLLMATVAFADGTDDILCANTRQTWTHDVSTVKLACNDFASIATLKTISGIVVSER
jgi:uncharacterized protein YcfJ